MIDYYKGKKDKMDNNNAFERVLEAVLLSVDEDWAELVVVKLAWGAIYGGSVIAFLWVAIVGRQKLTAYATSYSV